MSRSIALLMYHSVARATTPGFARLTVDPDAFEEHVTALVEAGFAPVTVAEAAARLRSHASVATDPPAVAITIDDALGDLVDAAIPALHRHGASATVFAPTAFVGGRAAWLRGPDRRRPLLSWDELVVLADAGIEIGSHGHRHIAYDVNSASVIERDARHSRALLEQRLQRPVASFAFPFGYGPRSARRAVQRAGSARPWSSRTWSRAAAMTASACRVCRCRPTCRPNAWWRSRARDRAQSPAAGRTPSSACGRRVGDTPAGARRGVTVGAEAGAL